MSPALVGSTTPASESVSQIRRMPKVTYCPIDVQRKFHTQPSSEIVISVGSNAASPRTKNSRKSSEKLAGLRGGEPAAPADVARLAARPVDSAAPGSGGI